MENLKWSITSIILIIAVLNECYTDAKHLAATETELPWETFPNHCPFSTDQILNPEFLPGN